MKEIYKCWEIYEFCSEFGRIIPHNNYPSSEFRSFHCENRNHDTTETIYFSEQMRTKEASALGLLTMSGYVVQFVDDTFVFCTLTELEQFKEGSERIKTEREEKRVVEREKEDAKENPARPKGLKITRDCMCIEYKAYYKCLDYPVKKQAARALGYLTPPFDLGDISFNKLLCKEDCIFCHCPFYDISLFNELRFNHRSDYDDWVMEFFKNFKR